MDEAPAKQACMEYTQSIDDYRAAIDYVRAQADEHCWRTLRLPLLARLQR